MQLKLFIFKRVVITQCKKQSVCLFFLHIVIYIALHRETPPIIHLAATMECVTSSACKMRHPFTCILAGASMSGKSYFLRKLINCRNEMIVPNVERVIYSYKKYQPLFDTMPDVQFVKGNNYKLDREIPTLLIIDDQAEDIDEKELVELFTVNCHHDNTSLIFVSQNLFLQSKAFRTAALNAQYVMMFKSPRGSSQISHLARQLNPAKAKQIQEIYRHATSEPYSYLPIDLKPDTPECLRYRTDILPEEGIELNKADNQKKIKLTRCYSV